MNTKKHLAVLCAAIMTAAASAAYAPAVFADSSAADTAVTAADNYTAAHPLTNPNATNETKRLYDYLCDNFGVKMIAGQQESTWKGTPDYEMNYIEETTGKLPALRGLDFMNDDFSGVVKRGIEWDAKGGIVEICWHCGVNGKGYNESKADDPDFEKLLDPSTDEYKAMMENWDKAGAALKELQDAGVPVLWRPFHEFDGQWFWWGKGGAENFKKLWTLMYDHYTNDLGLNNLIWVLGYADDVKSGWYPGDEYCDIVGSDTYRKTTDNKRGWNLLLENATDSKPMCFHECGNLPQIDTFTEDGVVWSWFMVWHTDYIVNNDKDNLTEVYNSDVVITLDELPDLKSYGNSAEDSSSDESSSEASSSETGSSQTDSSSQTSDSSSASSSSAASTSTAASTTKTATASAAASSDTSPATGADTAGVLAVAVLTAAVVIVSRKWK